jgi:hypothetical protein
MRRDMKKTLAVGVAGSALIWLWFNPLPVNASVLPQYQAFGNIEPWNVGDCQYEAAANLLKFEYPQANVTTNEVIRAYREQGSSNPALDGDTDALTFLMNYGFDGYKLGIFNQIYTRQQIIQDASQGGVWATLNDEGHAVAIIAANSKRVTFVDDGLIQSWTWSNWKWWRGHPYAMYALTWNTSTTTTLGG